MTKVSAIPVEKTIGSFLPLMLSLEGHTVVVAGGGGGVGEEVSVLGDPSQGLLQHRFVERRVLKHLHDVMFVQSASWDGDRSQTGRESTAKQQYTSWYRYTALYHEKLTQQK